MPSYAAYTYVIDLLSPRDRNQRRSQLIAQVIEDIASSKLSTIVTDRRPAVISRGLELFHFNLGLSQAGPKVEQFLPDWVYSGRVSSSIRSLSLFF
jgi:hypothetical protein